MGTAASSKWLRDTMGGEPSSAINKEAPFETPGPGCDTPLNSPTTAASTMVTLGGRLTAVHKELGSIRSDMSAAHMSVNPVILCAGTSKTDGKELVLSSDRGVQPTVLALEAGPLAEKDEGSKLRKRK